MKVAYIAGPYRRHRIHGATPHGIMCNIREAEAVALKYWRLGYAVICPHKNTAFLDGTLPDEVWLNGDLQLVSRVDVVVMMPDWRLSVGATEEHDVALKLGKEVIYEGRATGVGANW